MKEVLDSESPKQKEQELKLTVRIWIINIGIILVCYFLLNNPYMRNIIYNTEGSGNGYFEPIESFIFLGNIFLTVLLIQFERPKYLLAKIKLKLIPYYLSSSLLATALFFFLNYHISLQTYYADTDLGMDNPWSTSKKRSISYEFNGVMHTGNISPNLCECVNKIGLKQTTGLFGITVNQQEFRAPEKDMK